MNVTKINGQSFAKETLQAGKPAVVEFFAPWCGYCRRLGPVVERLAEQYADKISVGMLDIDEEPALAEEYAVDTIPTLILYQNGSASEPLVNPGSQAEIERWLEAHGAL